MREQTDDEATRLLAIIASAARTAVVLRPDDPTLVADLRAHTFTTVIPPDRARVRP